MALCGETPCDRLITISLLRLSLTGPLLVACGALSPAHFFSPADGGRLTKNNNTTHFSSTMQHQQQKRILCVQLVTANNASPRITCHEEGNKQQRGTTLHRQSVCVCLLWDASPSF